MWCPKSTSQPITYTQDGLSMWVLGGTDKIKIDTNTTKGVSGTQGTPDPDRKSK